MDRCRHAGGGDVCGRELSDEAAFTSRVVAGRFAHAQHEALYIAIAFGPTSAASKHAAWSGPFSALSGGP